MYQNNLFFKINVHHRHDGHHQYNDGKYAKCWICILNLFESPVANSLTLFEYNCAYQHVHCIGKKKNRVITVKEKGEKSWCSDAKLDKSGCHTILSLLWKGITGSHIFNLKITSTHLTHTWSPIKYAF